MPQIQPSLAPMMMKAPVSQFRLLFIVPIIFLLPAASSVQRDAYPEPSLSATLEPRSAVFSENEPLRLRLTIENSLPPCRPALIDPVISDRPCGDRPFTLVQLIVHDEAGKTITLENRAPSLAAAIEPGGLLELPCGNFVGTWLEIGPAARALWKSKLPPGKYTALAEVDIQVRSFYGSHKDLAEAEAKRRFRSPERLLAVLGSQKLSTETITFVVRAKPVSTKPER